MKSFWRLKTRPQLLMLGASLILGTWGIHNLQPRTVQAINQNPSSPKVLALSHFVPIQPLELHFTPKPDCAFNNCIALTFDDGPDPVLTPKILETLERQHVQATFFVIGLKVTANSALLQRMQRDGQEIGNHSWSHADFTKLKPSQMLEQINKTQDALIAAGVGPAKYFRLPYGDRNALVKQTMTLPSILWNVDPKDWKATEPKQLVEIMKQQARPNAIVVMHDTHAVTADALEEIIKNLKAANLQPVTLSDLLTLPPETHGEFMDRE